MYVFLKQSGELLARGSESDLWTPDGVRTSVDKAVDAIRNRKKLGMSGLTLVTGAGNIIRGDKLRQDGIANGLADVIGRLATVQNTLVLQAAFEERGIGVTSFVAANMRIEDPTISERLQPYDNQEALAAHEAGRIVLIGGGTGEDGVTTDNAVMTYATELRAEVGQDNSIVVLKGTKHDGVFEEDPAKNPKARRYATISAQYMLEHYATLAVVDRQSLEQIRDSGIGMRIYRDGGHDLSAVIAGLANAGTLIVSDSEHQPEFAQ